MPAPRLREWIGTQNTDVLTSLKTQFFSFMDFDTCLCRVEFNFWGIMPTEARQRKGGVRQSVPRGCWSPLLDTTQRLLYATIETSAVK